MLQYDLGEMKGEDGSALWNEVEAKASECAVTISRAIERRGPYRQLMKKVPSSRVLLYLQYRIKKEIYPFIRQACVIQWYNSNSRQMTPKNDMVLIPNYGVLPELVKSWRFSHIPVTLVHPARYCIFSTDFRKKIIIDYLRRCRNRMLGFFKRSTKADTAHKGHEEHVTLACHYLEGIDISRRSDLNWYPESGISPKRILIYFDSYDIKTARPVTKKVIQRIEDIGFRWVALKKNIIQKQGSYFWRAPGASKKIFLKNTRKCDTIDRWIAESGNELIKQVHFWRAFYDAFNIKVHYVPEEGQINNIAQTIAFDIDKKKPGILVGKQRSEIYTPFSSYLGYYPKHLFFIWNKRAISYIESSYEQIENFIVNGYPNQLVKGDQNLSSLLKSKGVRFIVALFDNAHGPNMHFSTRGMAEFYQTVLQWVLDDSTVGLIIKSKKPNIINNLYLIDLLFNKALETGRCIRLEDEWGRFPFDASFGADCAIGIGISTAVIESVIGGCRGIHYDATHQKSHEFYKWGYEQIVFDDLQRMMAALKRYKEDPKKEPRLGDWPPYLDMLDPFRDGRGGERMGVYMRWLLEAFDEGRSRREAIQYANKIYAERWGQDKVINMR